MNTHRGILLIGATGQLGSQILLRLQAAGLGCRVLVRQGSSSRLPKGTATDCVTGDLLNRQALACALSGMHTVISTANNIIPSRRDRFGIDELTSYQNLVAGALKAGVRRVVFVSAFHDQAAEGLPEFVVKRNIERLLHDSGLSYCVLRCSAFMDSYFPVVGSQLALRGSLNATVERPHWLQSLNRRLVGWPLDRGKAPVLPGNGRARHPYVALDDVADAVVEVARQEQLTGLLSLSGPESLSWAEIAQATGQALGLQLPPARHTPVAAFTALATLSRTFSPSATNLLSIMRYLSTHSLPPETPELARRLQLVPTTAARFLCAKAALPVPPQRGRQP